MPQEIERRSFLSAGLVGAGVLGLGAAGLAAASPPAQARGSVRELSGLPAGTNPRALSLGPSGALLAGAYTDGKRALLAILEASTWRVVDQPKATPRPAALAPAAGGGWWILSGDEKTGVQRLHFDGRFEANLTPPMPSEFSRPTTIREDEGRLYVSGVVKTVNGERAAYLTRPVDRGAASWQIHYFHTDSGVLKFFGRNSWRAHTESHYYEGPALFRASAPIGATHYADEKAILKAATTDDSSLIFVSQRAVYVEGSQQPEYRRTPIDFQVNDLVGDMERKVVAVGIDSKGERVIGRIVCISQGEIVGSIDAPDGVAPSYVDANDGVVVVAGYPKTANEAPYTAVVSF